jgi:hypothetical protein
MATYTVNDLNLHSCSKKDITMHEIVTRSFDRLSVNMICHLLVTGFSGTIVTSFCECGVK